METQTVGRKLFDLPDSMAALPRDERGFPVPKFVQWVKGKPDFRVMDGRHWNLCVKKRRCWLCGGVLGKRLWFVIGPMCAINRVSSEPPSHRLCAEFAVKNCPFLTRPLAKRADLSDVPEHTVAGDMIERNPGVTAIWETESYKVFGDGRGGHLLEVGPARNVSFWREGRTASRAEVMESVTSGVPLLWKSAEQEGNGAKEALITCCERFRVEILDKFTRPPPHVVVTDILRECPE